MCAGGGGGGGVVPGTKNLLAESDEAFVGTTAGGAALTPAPQAGTWHHAEDSLPKGRIGTTSIQSSASHSAGCHVEVFLLIVMPVAQTHRRGE